MSNTAYGGWPGTSATGNPAYGPGRVYSELERASEVCPPFRSVPTTRDLLLLLTEQN
jgi:hypothetical protein